MIDEKYTDWTKDWHKRNNHLLVKAIESVLEMKHTFPELIIVLGEVEVGNSDIFGDKRDSHIWLRDSEGHNIDPMSTKFSRNSSTTLTYHVKKEIKPTGKCVFCGKDAYDNRDFCCNICKEKEKMIIGLKETKCYKTSDGKLFESLESATEHQKNMNLTEEIDRFFIHPEMKYYNKDERIKLANYIIENFEDLKEIMEKY